MASFTNYYRQISFFEFDLLHSIGEAREGEKSQTLFPCSFSYKGQNCKQNGMRMRLNNTMYVFFSVLVDVKTGWKVGNWPLIQPRHCQQRDGYNCGVFV